MVKTDNENSANWQSERVRTAMAHQQLAFNSINELVVQSRKDKVILLDDGTMVTEFVSCSYLGLDQDERLLEAAKNSLYSIGIAFHCARTRVNPQSHRVLENYLHQIFSQMHAVFYPSTHMALQGFLPLLGSGEMPSFPFKKSGCVFILDKTVHASVQINRALLNQFGDVVLLPFQEHQQLEDNFNIAYKNNRTPIAITDSIGSMGGVADIKFLVALAEKYDGYICFDDAHGTSIHGQHGFGYVLKCLNGLPHPKVIIIATLGKGFGTLGGVMLLPRKEDTDFLKQFSSTYIFAGPPALSIVDAAIASAKIHLSDEIELLQSNLWKNIELFDKYENNIGSIINAHTPSPTRGIYIGDELTAIKCAKSLREKGQLVTTAMYPTVANEKSMLRIAFSANHTASQISTLSNAIIATLQQYKLRKNIFTKNNNHSAITRDDSSAKN